MTASADVSSSAAPRPLMARATLSTNGVHARPHSRDASANTARPNSITLRRPRRSAMLPAGSKNEANASM